MNGNGASAPRLALGLLELRGEFAGLQLLDAAIKSGQVQGALGQAVCPGKFFIMLTGQIAAVESALARGKQEASAPLLDPVILPQAHPDVWPALSGTTAATPGAGLAVLETYSAAAAVLVADAVAKAAGVRLLRIRLASGLGGKGLVMLTGFVADLREAQSVAERVSGDYLLDSKLIAAPHPRLWQFVL